MTNEQLLNKILKFAKKRGLSETAFGVQALRSPNLVRRIRAGSNITLRTVERIEEYMRSGK